MRKAKVDFALLGRRDEPVVMLFDSQNANGATGHCVVFVSSGYCMTPLIMPGDRLYLSEGDERLRIGQVVVYKTSGAALAHRVVRVSGMHFWARGDNALVVDGPIGIDSVIGRVEAIERDGVRAKPWGLVWPKAGLARAEVIQCIRRAREKWPRFARSFEGRVLGSSLVRFPFGRIVKMLLGDLSIEVDQAVESTLGEVLSHEVLLSEETTPVLERQLREKEISLLVMRDGGGRKVGMSVLCPAGDGADDDCALVFSIWLPFWLRGIGLGSELLAADMEEARRRGYGRIGAAVQPGNERSLGMFYKAGFHAISEKELLERGEPWDKKDLGGKIWLERAL